MTATMPGQPALGSGTSLAQGLHNDSIPGRVVVYHLLAIDYPAMSQSRQGLLRRVMTITSQSRRWK
ncbi:hypothetical protein BO98_02395 [Candidatus Synechococcus spongiarum LMB bulk10D]|nr:hypothetical protein BO98_02395 [Candidatus Synechococcus spongiarum LMB bulk10D]